MLICIDAGYKDKGYIGYILRGKNEVKECMSMKFWLDIYFSDCIWDDITKMGLQVLLDLMTTNGTGTSIAKWSVSLNESSHDGVQFYNPFFHSC